jgi:cytidyltransferase-like protein
MEAAAAEQMHQLQGDMSALKEEHTAQLESAKAASEAQVADLEAKAAAANEHVEALNVQQEEELAAIQQQMVNMQCLAEQEQDELVQRFEAQMAEMAKKAQFLERTVETQREEAHAERKALKKKAEAEKAKQEASMQALKKKQAEDLEEKAGLVDKFFEEKDQQISDLQAQLVAEKRNKKDMAVQMQEVHKEKAQIDAQNEETRQGKEEAVGKWKDRAEKMRTNLNATLSKNEKLEAELNALRRKLDEDLAKAKREAFEAKQRAGEEILALSQELSEHEGSAAAASAVSEQMRSEKKAAEQESVAAVAAQKTAEERISKERKAAKLELKEMREELAQEKVLREGAEAAASKRVRRVEMVKSKMEKASKETQQQLEEALQELEKTKQMTSATGSDLEQRCAELEGQRKLVERELGEQKVYVQQLEEMRDKLMHTALKSPVSSEDEFTMVEDAHVGRTERESKQKLLIQELEEQLAMARQQLETAERRRQEEQQQRMATDAELTGLRAKIQAQGQDQAEMADLRAKQQQQQQQQQPPPKKKVLVSGCFDLLHSGHVEFFREAAEYGELYVRIGTDKNIRALKAHETMYSDAERLFMVKNVQWVHDAALSAGSGRFDFKTDMEMIKPDIYICNDDASGMEMRVEICKELGIEMVVPVRKAADGLEARSSTSMKARLREMVDAEKQQQQASADTDDEGEEEGPAAGGGGGREREVELERQLQQQTESLRGLQAATAAAKQQAQVAQQVQHQHEQTMQQQQSEIQRLHQNLREGSVQVSELQHASAPSPNQPQQPPAGHPVDAQGQVHQLQLLLQEEQAKAQGANQQLSEKVKLTQALEAKVTSLELEADRMNQVMQKSTDPEFKAQLEAANSFDLESGLPMSLTDDSKGHADTGFLNSVPAILRWQLRLSKNSRISGAAIMLMYLLALQFFVFYVISQCAIFSPN